MTGSHSKMAKAKSHQPTCRIYLLTFLVYVFQSSHFPIRRKMFFSPFRRKMLILFKPCPNTSLLPTLSCEPTLPQSFWIPIIIISISLVLTPFKLLFLLPFYGSKLHWISLFYSSRELLPWYPLKVFWLVCFLFFLMVLTCSGSSFMFIIMVRIKSKGIQKSVNGFLCVLIGNSNVAQDQQAKEECISFSRSKIKTASEA